MPSIAPATRSQGNVIESSYTSTDDGAQERACTECGDAFEYSPAEQRFRGEHGMSPPVRCPRCRAQHRAERNADLLSAPAVVRNTPPRDRDRRNSRRGNGGAPQDRYPAVCADCGQPTMVPFMPRGDRPVYCRSCFNARRGK